MPVVFLPSRAALFVWGEPANAPPMAEIAGRGAPARAELVVPPGKRAGVSGISVPVLDALPVLAAIPAASIAELAPSLGAWTVAAKLALDLAVRERVVPRIVHDGGATRAEWAAALSSNEDAARVADLARAMPLSAYAVPVRLDERGSIETWTAEALVRAFLDSAIDALVRSELGREGDSRTKRRWERRWLDALRMRGGPFEPEGFGERTLLGDLERWSAPALGARDRPRGCFRLELPERAGDAFVLTFLLQSPDDPSLMVTAEQIWNAKDEQLAKLGGAFRSAQERLLEALGAAARLFAPIGASLAEPRPDHVALDVASAWAFLSEGAPALSEAGFGVIVPGELTPRGQRRLRLRMRVGGATTAGAVGGAAELGLDELLAFSWEAAIGDEALTARELAELAKHKAPLVRYRGAWVAVDPRELAEIRRRIAEGAGRIGTREALRAALAGGTSVEGVSVSVIADGTLARALERLRSVAADERVPPALNATLRPYQARGVAWLRTMASLGLGACLADDMGLGKTIQILGFLLDRLETDRDDERPALLVAPTSVVGNWEREIARFAPDLRVVGHYGDARATSPGALSLGPGTLIVTTYGILRRDYGLLAEVPWSTVVLDEAQNIKNAASATARAARAVSAAAPFRFALTGTPVENRLAELWSILEFANPGLLGPLEKFRREYAVPIERYGNDAASDRLRRIVTPFVLRRQKSDPAVLRDLPPKNEMKVVCTLTREQATLYRAVVDEEMRRIASAEGIERRGRVLALLMALKQICNHPAHYLGERGPLPRRSGKLARVTEMLEEATLAGDKALVFTQFREMGEHLRAHYAETLGVDVVFLHGGTPRRARDAMVRRFQEERHGPRVFVLSIKAGGTGLNLTAANHVFHYDRWWNPAVEDQATDRAYRIGQARAVQVHKLVCAGTVEEKVDQMLEKKRDLASRIVGSGERWITELADSELRDLFALGQGAVIGSDDAEDEAAPAAPKNKRRARASEARP